jgi:hypothetical protein
VQAGDLFNRLNLALNAGPSRTLGKGPLPRKGEFKTRLAARAGLYRNPDGSTCRRGISEPPKSRSKRSTTSKDTLQENRQQTVNWERGRGTPAPFLEGKNASQEVENPELHPREGTRSASAHQWEGGPHPSRPSEAEDTK